MQNRLIFLCILCLRFREKMSFRLIFLCMNFRDFHGNLSLIKFKFSEIFDVFGRCSET